MTDLDARHHDLLFLLGLAPMMALGCSVGVPDDGNQFTTATPSGGNPNPATSSASGETSEGSDDDGDTSGASASASASASVTASATVTASAGSSDDGASASASATVTASASDDGTTYGPPPYADCQAYGDLIAMCYAGSNPMAAAAYAAYCEEALNGYETNYGPACAYAFSDMIACLSALSCAELRIFGMGVCDAELAAFQGAC